MPTKKAFLSMFALREKDPDPDPLVRGMDPDQEAQKHVKVKRECQSRKGIGGPRMPIQIRQNGASPTGSGSTALLCAGSTSPNSESFSKSSSELSSPSNFFWLRKNSRRFRCSSSTSEMITRSVMESTSPAEENNIFSFFNLFYII